MYSRFEAAIFDQPVALTSNNIHNSPTVLLDPENVGMAAINRKYLCNVVYLSFYIG